MLRGKRKFLNLIDDVVDTFDVKSYLDNEDEAENPESPWFECPECGEPILWEDWKQSLTLERGICPICGFNFESGEMEEEE